MAGRWHQKKKKRGNNNNNNNRCTSSSGSLRKSRGSSTSMHLYVVHRRCLQCMLRNIHVRAIALAWVACMHWHTTAHCLRHRVSHTALRAARSHLLLMTIVSGMQADIVRRHIERGQFSLPQNTEDPQDEADVARTDIGETIIYRGVNVYPTDPVFVPLSGGGGDPYDPLPSAGWRIGFTEVETAREDGSITNALDKDNATIWHTRWSRNPPPFPHFARFEFGGPTWDVTGFRCAPLDLLSL